MQILITNDDGIRNEGILVLARWAATLGEVIVVAPSEEQSGKSQSVNLKVPFKAWESDFAVPGIKAWAGEMSPADCVDFAYYQLGLRPDYVFSGINRGYNIGREISYSGTDGAVFEAGSLGIRGVAFSTRPKALSVAERYLQKTWDCLLDGDLFSKCGMWNLNYPEIPDENLQIRFTKVGGIYLEHFMDTLGENTYKRHRNHGQQQFTDQETDIYTVRHGHISMTPLSSDFTNYSVLKSLV